MGLHPVAHQQVLQIRIVDVHELAVGKFRHIQLDHAVAGVFPCSTLVSCSRTHRCSNLHSHPNRVRPAFPESWPLTEHGMKVPLRHRASNATEP